jgi:uncharacterized protein YdhG (YjbR/CyaY superfamily)
MKKYETIADYIAEYPKDVQVLLEQLRATIKRSAPKATEAIKYGLPTFVLNGNLVHFGAFKNHIGFYPTPSGTQTFKKDLSRYEGGKGSIRFPLDKPLPLKLIRSIVEFRVKESAKKQPETKSRRTSKA